MATLDARAERPSAPPPAPPATGPFAGRLGMIFGVVVVGSVLAGVVLRLVTRSPLWEDEALAVALAKRPLGELPRLLRHDGAPPLYYVLLHAWLKVFGTGDTASRALSGLFGIATLPAVWLVGRRLGGPSRTRAGWVAWAGVVLLATSPYGIRYATEVRMYSMLTLLVLVGYVVVANALERPTLGWLAGVVILTALLLYTQYWAFYVLGVLVLALVVLGLRTGPRAPAWRVVAAIAVGGITFVPWLPTFLYQSRHTGTPWAIRLSPPTAILRLIRNFGGEAQVNAYLLAFVLTGLVLLGVFGAPRDASHTDLDWRTQPVTRWAAYITGATILIGMTAAYVGIGAAAVRYSSIVFGLYCVIAAFGVVAFGSPRLRYGVLVVVVALGLAGGIHNAQKARTQAAAVGRAINAGARAGDVVVYCPDQLGTDTVRRVRSGLRQYAFPTLAGPEIVNWVDYEQRNQVFHRPGVPGNLAEPAIFAREVLRRAGPRHTLWYVYANGYKTFGDKCQRLRVELHRARRDSHELVTANLDIFESMTLVRFGP